VKPEPVQLICACTGIGLSKNPASSVASSETERKVRDRISLSNGFLSREFNRRVIFFFANDAAIEQADSVSGKANHAGVVGDH